ncbi:MAG: hypothetical protein HS099_17530 [Ardenticatenaceae bacterium]|nr:hypothetical protein [Ardenticatenaceae bacterium]
MGEPARYRPPVPPLPGAINVGAGRRGEAVGKTWPGLVSAPSRPVPPVPPKRGETGGNKRLGEPARYRPPVPPLPGAINVGAGRRGEAVGKTCGLVSAPSRPVPPVPPKTGRDGREQTFG